MKAGSIASRASASRSPCSRPKDSSRKQGRIRNPGNQEKNFWYISWIHGFQIFLSEIRYWTLGVERWTFSEMPEQAELVVEGKKLSVSNLNKVLYPKVGFTKGQVIDYYIRIAPVLLPHLKDRPLTMKRYPNGVDKEFFYEKNCPTHRP